MNKTRCSRNGKTLGVMPAYPYRKLKFTQMTLKCTVTPAIINTVNLVKWMEQTAKQPYGKRYFWIVTPGVRLSHILERPLVLNLVVPTDEWDIGLRANTTKEGHTPNSGMQPRLDPGTKRCDSCNVVTITNRQRDATFVHSCEVSRFKIIGIFTHILRRRKEVKITKLGAASSMYTGWRHGKNTLKKRGSRREADKKRRCGWSWLGASQSK